MWLSGWTYRKKITISGSSGAGTGYQVLLKVGESSGASGCDFHVEGHSENFPSDKNQSGDLRFTDDDGETLLSFWVEKVEGSSPNRVAYCWVKVNDSLDSDVDIYCYYGNASASNVSNGDDTFEFFDDFEGTSLDTNKWEEHINTPGTASISVHDSMLDIYHNWDDYSGDVTWVQTKNPVASSDVNLTLEAMVKVDTINGNGDTAEYFINPTDDYYYRTSLWTSNNTGEVRRWSKTSAGDSGVITMVSSYSVNTWYRHKIKRKNATTTIFCHDSTEQTDSNYSAEISDVKVRLANGRNIERHAYWDWVFVRKYTDPEPAFSSAGSEETRGGNAIFFGINF